MQSTFNVYDIRNVMYKGDGLVGMEWYSQPGFELTPEEEQILKYLISRMNVNNPRFMPEIVSLKGICDLFEVNTDKDSDKEKLRQILVSFGSKSFVVPITTERDIFCHWVEIVKIDYGFGLLEIKLSDTLRPYYLYMKDQLFHVPGNFNEKKQGTEKRKSGIICSES